MSEAQITIEFNKHLVKLKEVYGKSLLTWKISDRYASGRPDYKIGFMGELAYVELKAEGESPRPRQTHEIRRLQQAGFMAVWFDNSRDACDFVDDMISKRLDKLKEVAHLPH